MAGKQREYDKLPMKSIEQIYASIEVNIPDDYVYNENTTIVVFDSAKENTGMLTLDAEQIELVNDIHPICRGTALYDIYTRDCGASPACASQLR
jgi:hypothetical protein